MDFQLIAEPTKEDIETIRTGLSGYNRPFLEGVVDLDFVVYALDEEESKIGGCTARILGSWLLLKWMWVDESHKGKGVGSRLLAQVEHHAKVKGCKHCLVDTFSFQAKPFYEKQGYQCQMTLDDYAKDGQLHFLTKELVNTQTT